MYLGIDVGGSKTLVGVLDEHGVIAESIKFPTPVDYNEFLDKLAETVASFTTKDFRAVGCGIPVTSLDRRHGIGLSFSNLPWLNVPIMADIEALAGCPALVENDAKLGCLSEAMLRPEADKVLYITISTGIGYGLVSHGQIDTSIGDSGGRLMLMEFHGKPVPWESFASGKAIVERFGKMASQITDTATWQRIAHDLAGGFMELIAITEPSVVVVGGSVGTYFDRLQPYLLAELKRRETPLLAIPPIEEAKRPEEAVLYGCYDLVKGVYGRHRSHSAR